MKKTLTMARIQKAMTQAESRGVTEKFMVWLARAVKDAQAWMKSTATIAAALEHFIHNCPLMKTARDKKQLNGKEGTAMMKGAQTPSKAMNAIKSPQEEAQEV